MPRIAKVNYHVHQHERQAFHIDAGGVVGKLISPELVATPIQVKDLRCGEVAISFEEDFVAFARTPTKVRSFTNGEDWLSTHDDELTALLTRDLGAEEVVIFDHTVRTDDPNSDRKPARNVHSDYSADGAHQRLVGILGEDRAADWSKGHYGFINVWRPVGEPINSAPLGFVRPFSVAEADWIMLDLIYPDRLGHIMGLAASGDHEWVYQSRMSPDDVAIFNIYDNRGRASIAHSAMDLVEDETINIIRTSIESRTLVRY